MPNIPSMLAKPLMRRPIAFLAELCELHNLTIVCPDININGHENKRLMVKELIKLPLETLKLPPEEGETALTAKWRREYHGNV